MKNTVKKNDPAKLLRIFKRRIAAVNSGTNLSGDQSGVIGDYFGNIAK